jgi:uronate dehydrogenase
VFGEALGRLYADRYGMDVVCLRIGSVREDDVPTRNEEAGRSGRSDRSTRTNVDTAFARPGCRHGVRPRLHGTWLNGFQRITGATYMVRKRD